MGEELLKLIKDFIYYEEFGQGKSINTIKSYRRDLGQLFEYIEGLERNLKLEEIDEMMLRGFLIELQREKISKRSLNRKLSSIRGFFKYLKAKEVLDKNPTLLLSGPAFHTKQPEVLSLDEIDSLREVIDTSKANGLRDRLIIELLYSSGIRASELLALSENLFDLERRQLKVSSGKQPRMVFYSERTREYYTRYIEAKKEKYKEKYTSDILFVNGSGTRLSDRSLRRIIDRYVKKAKITDKEVSPHTFRHTFGVYMVQHEMDILYLQELMGHVSIESTRIYEEMVGRPKILKGYALG